MKKLLKKYLPDNIVKLLKKVNQKIKLDALYRYDKMLFKKYYKLNNTVENLEADMMFSSHAIEKGLSHSNFRPNFGEKTLIEIKNEMDLYDNKNYDKQRLRYQILISSLKNYIDYHKSLGYEPKHIKKIFNDGDLKIIESANKNLSGVKAVLSKDKLDHKSYIDIVSQRSSVREYDTSVVSIDKIKDAIQISTYSPSVCNRQSVKVKIILNPSLIQNILEVQGGFNGFDAPPVLLVVTSQLNSFINPTERNQPFIDGGLFSMSLLNALEYEGLGACALNAMMPVESEQKVLKLLDVLDNERLIMFISVGNLKDSIKVPLSHRDDITNIISIV